MNIDIKKSAKPVKYIDAIEFLEKRAVDVNLKKKKELVWILEHPSTFTAGKRYKESEILDKKIKLIQTSRGGKITWHGQGQLICYFVIDLSRRGKDIRKFINLIEKTIIETLKKYNIYSFSDRKNIGIWIKDDNKTKKVGAIGIKIRKWIAFHGFSLNIYNDLTKYNKIIPCGIKSKGITSFKEMKIKNYNNIEEVIINRFLNIFL